MAFAINLVVHNTKTARVLATIQLQVVVGDEHAEAIVEMVTAGRYHLSEEYWKLENTLKEFYGKNEVTIVYMKERVAL